MSSNEQKENDINIKYVLKWAKWKAIWINEQEINDVKVNCIELNAQIRVSN